jgi:uncharacterized protein YcgI (DUF1989 family)
MLSHRAENRGMPFAHLGQMNETIPLDLNREQPFRWRLIRRSTVKTPTGRANNLSPGPFLKVVDRCGNQAGEPA